MGAQQWKMWNTAINKKASAFKWIYESRGSHHDDFYLPGILGRTSILLGSVRGCICSKSTTI